MKIPLVDLKAQYNSISEELNKATIEVLSSAKYIMGENVTKFEKEFSSYLGSKYAISVGNGTDALVIGLKALGICEGDEVITSPFTFFSTAESIAAIGAIPVFVDVDIDTFNIDVSKIEEKITKKTKAIMPVHIFGQSADMDEITSIAKKYSLYVIEDACQAIGAEYKGKKTGTIGDIGCFSFFPTKNLGAAGDGGMIVTNDEKVAVIASALRTHGSGENGRKACQFLNNDCLDNEHLGNKQQNVNSKSEGNDTVYDGSKYYNYLIAHNSRLDALQAALLRVKLKYIDKWNQKRIENAKKYDKRIDEINSMSCKKIKSPYSKECNKHVYNMYVVQSEERGDVIKRLKDNGVSTGIYYPIPLQLQKAFDYLGYKQGDLPNSEYLSNRTFAIPVYPELSDSDQEYIIKVLEKSNAGVYE
jgi:dTDP-4-amino-4,6-dideoxygalactose transaminase